MKTFKQTVLALTLSLIAVVPAFAGQTESHATKQAGLLARAERQHQQINQGIKHKELTRKETKVLKHEQRQNKRLARMFYEDGHLSKHERRVLNHRLDRSDKHIYRLKHNEMTRYMKYHEAYAHRDHCRL